MSNSKRKKSWIGSNGLTLQKEIFKYRDIKKKTFIIMILIIIALLFINYSNISYLNSLQCDQSFNLQATNQATQIEKKLTNSENTINKKTTATTIDLSTRDQSIEDEHKSNTASLKFHDVFEQFDYLQNKRRILQPKILISKHKNNASIAIGIPTVKRKSSSYLILMLTSLFDALYDEQNHSEDSILVVVLISEVFF